MAIRVVYYARVSTSHEEQISALSNQKAWYMEVIEKHKDWILVDTYVDDGVSGTSTKHRTEFRRMMDDGMNGHKFDLIITREVSRFARNTMHALEWARKLKAVGIGIYFVSDCINTMDSQEDGETRFTIMASLAQDESRKISNRVNAGLQIAREKGVILGNGNIFGYQRIGRGQFVVDLEQATVVKKIYQWYLDGKGVKKIKNLLEQNHYLSPTGNERWQISTIGRILSNPFYIGYQNQLQSKSDGYLTQNRVKNDKSDWVLVKGTHEAIIDEAVFQSVQDAKTERLTHDVNNRPTGRKMSSDIWTEKLVCKCGSRYKKYRWHEGTYGYTCYDQVNNGKKSFREEHGLPSEWNCDLSAIPDWKLEMMLWKVIQKTWTSGVADIERAFEIIKECYCAEADDTQTMISSLKQQIGKLERRKNTLIGMRADGELTKEEFAEQKKGCDEKLETLQAKFRELEKKINTRNPENLDGMLLKIKETMAQMIDFSAGTVDQDLLDSLVKRIVHVENGEFDIYLNLGVGANALGEEEKIIPIKKFSAEGMEVLRENHIRIFDMQIGFEEAKEYRNMFGKYLRVNQWNDLTVHVYL